MKIFHLHVGSDKCASTLIQAVFSAKPMRKVMEQYSIDFPHEVFHSTSRLSEKRITSFQEDKNYESERSLHFETLKNSPSKGFFMTQECFFGVTVDKGMSNSCQASCDAISYLTEGFDTRIIIVLRRQDTYLESYYNQKIKRGETRTFDDFLDEVPLENLEWDFVVDTYANRFGKDKVTVVPFERNVLQTGDIGHIIEGITAAIGIPDKFEEEPPRVNPSFAPSVLERQRQANINLSEEDAWQHTEWLAATYPKELHEPHNLMSEDDRHRLIEFYRKSNARLVDKYMQGFDGEYYMSL